MFQLIMFLHWLQNFVNSFLAHFSIYTFNSIQYWICKIVNHVTLIQKHLEVLRNYITTSNEDLKWRFLFKLVKYGYVFQLFLVLEKYHLFYRQVLAQKYWPSICLIYPSWSPYTFIPWQDHGVNSFQKRRHFFMNT